MAKENAPQEQQSQYARNSEVARNVGILTAVGGLIAPILLIPGLLLAGLGEWQRRSATKEKVVYQAKRAA